MASNSSARLSLREQSSTLDTASKDHSLTTLEFPRIHPTPHVDQNMFSQTDAVHVPAETMSRDPPSRNSPEPGRGQTDSQGHYIGSSSAVSFLLRIQKRLHQNSSLSYESSIFTFGDAPLPEFDPSFFVLPPKPDAQRLVERYFDYAAPTHRFLHRPTIEGLVEEFYETQGDMRSKEDAPAKISLLLIVFAQAQAYMPPGSTTRDNSLDKYLAAALGRPRTFKDEDIDQELPIVVNDSDLHPQYINPSTSKSYCVMMAPVEHIKLSRIVSLVLRDLYSIRPPSMSLRIELSSKYTADLHHWRASLSRFLNDDEGRIVDSHLLIPIYQRQRSVLNLAYWHAMLLIHRPFLLSNFESLARMPIHSTFASSASIDTSANVASCLEAAMSIVRVTDDVFMSSNLFRSFWFTQYYAFCAVVVLYVYRIQQHLISPGKCEGYFAAGQKCQRQLESVSETDCLARRYCLVLEELRLEAARPTSEQSPFSTTTTSPNATTTTTTTITASATYAAEHDVATTPGLGATATQLYASGGSMPTPDSAVFHTSFLPNSSIMADLTSWGQFDSLVTAGIGLFDGAGMQGDGGGGFGLGL
ncbi:hypothetical protein ACEQ8H_006840 [Pleosporales sp. CAS-2024a]